MAVTADLAKGAVYWSEGNFIGRANVDGSDPNFEFISGRSERAIGSVCGLAVNESHIFWADAVRNAIGRANIDGTEPNYSFITDAREPCGIAVDESYVYWANRNAGFINVGDVPPSEGPGSIGRARLDGSEPNQEYIVGPHRPCGVAVDDDFVFWTAELIRDYVGRALLAGPTVGPHLVEGTDSYDLCGVVANDEHVFWGGFGEAIGRVKANGADPEPSFIEGIRRPCDLALDDTHIYWNEQARDSRVGRARLDGTGIEEDIVTAGNYECGVAVDSRTVPPLPPPYVPPPRPGICDVGKVHYNRFKGIASVLVFSEVHAGVRVRTRGLGWKNLTKAPPPHRAGSFIRRLKIWPLAKGRAGKRIRRQLARRGRARVKLRVRCKPWEAERLLPAVATRKMVLRRRVAVQRRTARGHSRK